MNCKITKIHVTREMTNFTLAHRRVGGRSRFSIEQFIKKNALVKFQRTTETQFQCSKSFVGHAARTSSARACLAVIRRHSSFATSPVSSESQAHWTDTCEVPVAIDGQRRDGPKDERNLLLRKPKQFQTNPPPNVP